MAILKLLDYSREALQFILFKKSSGLLFFVIFCLFSVPSFGQVILSGKILDSVTKQPIAFASVSVVGQNTGDLTDDKGNFSIKTSLNSGKLRFSSSGYQTVVRPFSGSRVFTILLPQSHSVLNVVTITGKKEKYRNKNNPAVELIREVLAHKAENQPANYDHVQYQQYERAVLYLVNPGVLENNFLLKKYKFVFENADSTKVAGSNLVPLYIEEEVYDKYNQKEPERKRSILKAEKRTNLNNKFVNNNNLGQVVKYLYQNIDLYQGNINLLTTNFMSPINSLAPQFYRYYITDTLKESDGSKIVKLNFEPRNNFDQLFYGTLYIALNGHFSLVKAEISIPRVANVNWVKSLNATLDYGKDDEDHYFLEKSHIGINFGIKLLKQGIYGEKDVIISKFNSRDPLSDQVFEEPSPVAGPDSIAIRNKYIAQNRPDTLDPILQRGYKNIDSLNHVHSFERLVDWGSFLFAGYKQLGPVEIGKLGRFYSFNEVEGFRPRIGGRTTERLNKSIYGSVDLAYGTRDKRFKYRGMAFWSLNKKNVFTGYPNHYFQVTALYDTRIPGRVLSFDDEASIFFSFKHGENNKYLYNRTYRAEYVNELIPHLRFDLQAERTQQEPGGILHFLEENKNGGFDTIRNFTTGGLGLTIRWAPGERFVQGKTMRVTLPNHNPIITASVMTGMKGFLGGQFNYQKYELTINQRLYLSKWGIADITVAAGAISGQVPYPLLFIPSANNSYVFDRLSFNLMNPLEFVSDHYASWNIDYHLKGFILGRIPGIQWLRLREVAGFRGIFGGLRSENQIAINALPSNPEGQQVTYFLNGRQPYLEYNIGIENIFYIFRVDYVRRINYMGNTNASKSGFRISLNANF